MKAQVKASFENSNFCVAASRNNQNKQFWNPLTPQEIPV